MLIPRILPGLRTSGRQKECKALKEPRISGQPSREEIPGVVNRR